MPQPGTRMTSAFVVSLVCHATAIALVLIAIRSGTRVDRVVSRGHDHVPAALVWLPEVGPGGGGGGGPGRGRGLRDGLGAGVDGDRYGGGAGLVMPRLLRIVKPQYTTEAMTARIQGSVIVACIVQTDGTVADARVARSLDPVFGLDGEAIKATRQWQFLPATRLGKPVPIRVTIEVTFTVR